MQPALLQIQNDITARLSVELAAWGITVRSQRKMIIANEVDEAQLVMSLTNGKTGAGCLVQMPTFATENPNAPGPVGFVQLIVTCKEAPELNMNASTGTLRSAEEIAIRALGLLHLWRIVNIGTIYSSTEAIRKSTAEAGIVAYDVSMRIQLGYDTLAATGNPVISGTSTAVTLTNASGFSGSTIYYSKDGESYPGPDQENSFTYSAPFAVDVDTVIRAAAYKDGYTGSDIIEETIST
jgi:hypothetical protein